MNCFSGRSPVFLLDDAKVLVVEQGQRRKGGGAKVYFQVNTDNSPLKISS